MIDACLKEVEFVVVDYNIPSKEELMADTISEPIEWDAIESHTKFFNQSEKSYQEQRLATTIRIDTIDCYRDTLSQGSTQSVLVSVDFLVMGRLGV